MFLNQNCYQITEEYNLWVFCFWIRTVIKLPRNTLIPCMLICCWCNINLLMFCVCIRTVIKSPRKTSIPCMRICCWCNINLLMLCFWIITAIKVQRNTWIPCMLICCWCNINLLMFFVWIRTVIKLCKMYEFHWNSMSSYPPQDFIEIHWISSHVARDTVVKCVNYIEIQWNPKGYPPMNKNGIIILSRS